MDDFVDLIIRRMQTTSKFGAAVLFSGAASSTNRKF